MVYYPHMEITYLGHASFLLQFGKTAVLVDPYSPKSTGFEAKKVKPDLITVSNTSDEHKYLADYPSVAVFDLPGEYEKNGVYMRGIATFRDNDSGKQRGKNIVFKFEWEGKSVLHLGDLGHMLNAEALEEIGSVDVLLLPIGGHHGLDLDVAMKLLNKLECQVCIPMLYRSEEHAESFMSLHTLEDFFKKLGNSVSEAVKTYKFQKNEENSETQVLVLERAK